MDRFRVPHGLALRHWDGESTAVVRLADVGTTHLIGAEALAVLQSAADGRDVDKSSHDGLTLREIAHALGLAGESDPEVEASLSRIIDGLVQSGLLRRECPVDDDDHLGSAGPR